MSRWTVEKSKTRGTVTHKKATWTVCHPVTGKGHWYAVTSDGETHDHVTEWTDANNMKASYSWVEDGKNMLEIINVGVAEPNFLEFRSTITVDGQEAGSFSGKLTH